MSDCVDCEARFALLRQAAVEMRLLEAAGHLVKGAAEVVGVKKKTGAAERKAKKTPPSDDYAKDE